MTHQTGQDRVTHYVGHGRHDTVTHPPPPPGHGGRARLAKQIRVILLQGVTHQTGQAEVTDRLAREVKADVTA